MIQAWIYLFIRGKEGILEKKEEKNFLCLYYIIAGQFLRSHGSYNQNLGSEIVILGGDIRSRSWPNIGGTYGTIITD